MSEVSVFGRFAHRRGVGGAGRGTLRHPFVTLDSMMFQTRCAGCDAPGVAVCTTCRFALARTAPAAARTACTPRCRSPDGPRGRARAEVPQPAPGRSTSRRTGRQRRSSPTATIATSTWSRGRRPARRGDGARGFDQGELMARSRRSPARRAVPPAARAVRSDGHAQTGRSRRASRRGAVRGPTRPRRTSGDRRRRRRHHRCHPAGRPRAALPHAELPT